MQGWQEELFFHPAQQGGLVLPSLTATKECAFKAGTTAAPYIREEEVPTVYTNEFLQQREHEVEDAIPRVQNLWGVDLKDSTRVTPKMFAREGFGKFHSSMAKIVREAKGNTGTTPSRSTRTLGRPELHGGRRQISSPGVAAWVTVPPTTPETALEDVGVLIAFRARLGLPQVRSGYPMRLLPE
jgi:hypothetical protein